MNKKNKVVLCIMDGYGIREESYGNAIKNANKPNIDYLFKEYPSSLLEACGDSVGLHKGQMGNSEVGHTNIGAGRIVYQSLSYINKSIEDGSFYKNESFFKAFNYVKDNNSSLHLFILYSSGGVHSHLNHLLSFIDLAKQNNVKDIKLHLFLDGRDVHPKSFLKEFNILEDKINQNDNVKIATISGRYYAMDRDKNLERTLKAYECIVLNEGNSFSNPRKYIEQQYTYLNKIGFDSSDEFVLPGYNNNIDGRLKDNDAVVYLNFRPDRAIQLSTLITNPKFYDNVELKKELNNVFFVSFMKYSESVLGEVAFTINELKMVLGEYLSKKNKSQLRIAETEKYAHVTYFFDGMKKYDGVENPLLSKSKRILINSPKVTTYDLMPEMSAYEVLSNLLREVRTGDFDFIVVNFANCDMVGHTAVYKAVIKAVEVVDECIGKLYQACQEAEYDLIVTADHGNADMVFDKNDNLVSSHTLSLVPFLITRKDIKLIDGVLADIAPTIFELMDLEKPNEMSGVSLIEREEK